MELGVVQLPPSQLQQGDLVPAEARNILLSVPDRGWLAGNELQGRAGFAASLISRQVLEILGNEMESRKEALWPEEESHLVSGILGKGGGGEEL